MKAKRAAIALAILFGGFGMMAQDATARTTDSRQGKPSARTASVTSTPRPAANATARTGGQRSQVAATSRGNTRAAGARRGGGRAAYAGSYGGGGVSCVPYARQVTGMTISGNGGQWWYNAAGLYARGHRPEVGSILAFPGSGGMRAGHVAVVERIVSPREILIHHANWGGPGIRRGSIMSGVSVIDASPNNDWTQVRVQVGHSAENYGRIYAVQGFIHNRPDAGGAVYASSSRYGLEEVAEAPATRGRSTRR
ncbi:CHAP domain-containing protein [Roseomonas sp. JC162]|uniref:CHAP domain-containing protein n=1 Tax=Neoroseomonas marina TaxID=1232220 RepID=A0A848EDN9_9PROT|nr:CHAP domain-containing protein [Neoroseomonas marina]